MSQNFNETVLLQSKKRKEGYERGETIQGIAEGASRASGLGRSLPPSFLGRNECPGTHCSLIEHEEREDSSCQICLRDLGKRKNGREDRASVGEEEKWQTCWCCRDQQRACRVAQASVKRFEHIGPAEKESVASLPQREQLASTPEPSLPKGEGTELSVQSTRSRGGREERVDFTVKEGRFQRGEGGQAK